MEAFSPRKRKGVGERVFSRITGPGGSYGYSGGAFLDKLQQVQSFRHWCFVAIRAVYQEIASIPPNIAVVRPGARAEYSRNMESPRRQKRFEKSLKHIQPHEEVEPVEDDHPLRQLFARPNDVDMSSDILAQLSMFLELTGESFIWTPRNVYGAVTGRQTASEMWVVPSHWVYPLIRGRYGHRGDEHAQGLVETYEIRPLVGAAPFHFPADEVIMFRYPSPLHMVRGWSPPQAGSEWIDGSDSIDKFRYWTMKNGCFTLGSIELDPTIYPDPDDAQIDRLAARFYARWQSEQQAGRPVIMPPGARFTPLTIGGPEMPFVQSADQLRDNTLALWSLGKSVVGIEPAGDNISWYAALKQFFRICICPRLGYLGQVFTRHLAGRWDPQLRIWWDDPMPADPAQDNADLAADNAAYVTTINERRAARGLEAKPGFDFIPGPMGLGAVGNEPLDLPPFQEPKPEENGKLDSLDNKPASIERLFPVIRAKRKMVSRFPVKLSRNGWAK